MITCCKDCVNRHVGCHGECESYKQQKENHTEEQRWLYIQNARSCSKRIAYGMANWVYGDRDTKRKLGFYKV